MLFEKYVICDDGFGNITDEDGNITGFQVKVRAPYYRAVRLSLVESITLKIDQHEYSPDEILFTVADGTFTFDEMKTCYDLYWGFGEPATLTVKRSDGIGRSFSTGWHNVEVSVVMRIIYAPGGFRATCSKMMYKEY